jgi:hypothetical protein
VVTNIKFISEGEEKELNKITEDDRAFLAEVEGEIYNTLKKYKKKSRR